MLIRSDGKLFEDTSIRLQQPRPANLKARYWTMGEPRVREKDSLEYFLTERYCLYTVNRGAVLRAYVHHLPWQLQDADAEFEMNTMAQAAGIELPDTKPLLHYSSNLEVLVWKPEKVG